MTGCGGEYPDLLPTPGVEVIPTGYMKAYYYSCEQKDMSVRDCKWVTELVKDPKYWKCDGATK